MKKIMLKNGSHSIDQVTQAYSGTVEYAPVKGAMWVQASWGKGSIVRDSWAKCEYTLNPKPTNTIKPEWEAELGVQIW